MLHTPLLTTAQTRAPEDPEPPATATVNTQQFSSRQLSLTVLQPPVPMTVRTTMNSWGDMPAFTTRWDVGDHWHRCCFWTIWIFCENPLHQKKKKKKLKWSEWSSWQQLSVWTKCADRISFWWFYLFAWWTCTERLTDWFCFIVSSPVECFYRHVQQKEAFVSFERWQNTFTQPWIFFKVCIYIVITHRPHPLFYWVTITLSRSISFCSDSIKLPSIGLWSSHLQLSVLLFIWIHHQISQYAVAILPEAPILHFQTIFLS